MHSISKNNRCVLIIGVIVPCFAHLLIGLVSSESSPGKLTVFDLDDPETHGTDESVVRFGRKIIQPNDTGYNPNATVKELNAAYFTAKAEFIARNSTTPAPPTAGNGTAPAAGNGTAPAGAPSGPAAPPGDAAPATAAPAAATPVPADPAATPAPTR